MATRELFVKTMILPILDYGEIVWGDKHNQTLMHAEDPSHPEYGCESNLR